VFILQLFDDLSVFIIMSYNEIMRISLNPVRKTAVLGILILLFYVPPIFSQDFFFEEFFLFENLLPPSEEHLPSEESLPSEETVLSEESLSDKEFLLSVSAFQDEEHFLSEESHPIDDLYLYDETYLTDDDLFVFEAPPLVYEVPRFIYEIRSFDELFPNFTQRQKTLAFSNEGLKYSFEKGGSPRLLPAVDSGIDLLSSVMSKKPSHIIEAMAVVPYHERELDILDVYNALGYIENLKNHSFRYNGRDINIFEETTRIESARNRKAIPDPPPADMLPYSETMYLRFKDSYYGNLFIRGDISMSLYGITYSMTNFTDVRYLLVPIIKTEGISIIIYLEPVKEGVLVYSMSGIYLPGFIADRVNIAPNINRRVNALISWITEGLRRQESIARENEVLEIGRAEVAPSAGD
jgi:hypothetical protein